MSELLKNVENPISEVENAHYLTTDEKRLLQLGYKQEFRRELNFWTTFAVAFSVIGTLPSVVSSFVYGIGYIGLPGITWGWIVACSGIISISLAMAELASSTPTSGGLYYSSYVLSPPGWGPFFAWVTGWSNWLGQVTWAPSTCYALSLMIFSIASMNDASFTPQRWQNWLLTVALMTLVSISASLPTKYVAQFNSFSSFFNICCLIIVFVSLLAGDNRKDPKFNSNHQVWSEFTNSTEWPDGIALLMSFLAAIWAQAGFDGAFHLSEECSNAEVAVPRAIIMTTCIGSSSGFVLLLVIAYTLVDLDTVLSDPFPFAKYSELIVGRRAATALLSLIAVCSFLMASSCALTASRVFFAYARDGCFPFSSFWSHVSTITKTPVRAVWANYVIGILLCLLLFNDVAINAIFSLGASAAYVAFIVPVILKNTFALRTFKKGPWSLGRYSPFVGFYAISFVLLMLVILCFPATRGNDLTASDMNWTVLCYWGPMLIATVWYLVDARKWFKGPKLNVDISDTLSEFDSSD